MTKSEAWAIGWAQEIAPTVLSDVGDTQVIESHIKAGLLTALQGLSQSSELRALGAFRMDVTTAYPAPRIL